jgi:hypothetical protein
MRPRTAGVLFVVLGALTYAAGYVSWQALMVLVVAWFLSALLGLAVLFALPATDAKQPPLRLVLQTFAALVALAVAAGAAYLFAPVPVGATTLRGSVERETDSAGLAGECRHLDGPRWRCDVADTQGSGSATYAVEVDGRCWQARRSSPDHYTEGPMPARAAGCTRLRDAISLLD